MVPVLCLSAWAADNETGYTVVNPYESVDWSAYQTV